MPLPLSIRWLFVPAGAALLGGGWALSGPKQAAPPTFQRAWWYWHHPFRLSAADVRDLRHARCERLYVHAGTVIARDGRLALTSSQRFETAAPCSLYAVLRIHPASHPILLSPEGPDQIARLLPLAKLPPGVRGLQLDADIPTARLADYAQLLNGVRRRLPSGWSLSVTALPDWLGTRDYARVCDAVNEVAPQFYGNRWPVAGRKPPPLWESVSLSRQLDHATAGKARAWIGLPSYGRCVVLDPSGRPIGVRHDLDPEALQESPDWTVPVLSTRATDEPVEEDSLTLRAATETAAGSLVAAPGTSLWFQWPRVDALERTEQQLAALHLPTVAGVCYFRWPAPGEPLALRPQPHTVTPAAQPLTLSFQSSANGTQLVVHNRGADAARLPEGIQVTLTGDLSAMESDGPTAYRCGDEPCSPLRADRALFSRMLLRPGPQWTVCRLPPHPGSHSARLTWHDGAGHPHTITAELTPGERTR